MAKKIVIGNWKMNPATLEEAKGIFSGMKKNIGNETKTDIVLCVPTLFLEPLRKLQDGSKIRLGVQDVFYEQAGSFTGFLSPDMVRNAGAEYVIIGHSERRRAGESDEVVNKKNLATLGANLKVVLCVGESERTSSGAFLEFIKNQIQSALLNVKKTQLKNIIIAYEPVWAIGAKEAMNPRDLHQMTLYIRKVLVEMYGKAGVFSVPILYGGSVTSENAPEIICEGESDGLLVGRESLNPERFGQIIEIASTIKCKI